MKWLFPRFGLIALGASGATVAVAALVLLPGLRWRIEVLALDARGRIPDVRFGELVSLMMPSSGQTKLALLKEIRNPYAVIVNPLTSPDDVRTGAALFRGNCAECHLPDGRGGPQAPALFGRELAHGASDWAIYRTIRYGVRGTAMAPHPLASRELWSLVTFIRSLGGSGAIVKARTASAPFEGAPTRLRIATDLDFAALSAVKQPGPDWVTYGGSYASQRHSALTEVTLQNAPLLAMRWQRQFDGDPAKIECSPIVYHGVMYFTVPPRVMALDAATGKQLWVRDLNVHSVWPGEEGGQALNRGVALLGDKIFVGTRDARLIALSATTGAILWQTVVADKRYHDVSPAPLVVHNLVIVGGGVYAPRRGFIAAYDVNTGRERWRFATVPGPGEKGHETWSGGSWRGGGGATWVTGSYDPQLDLVYWGVGNPKPDYDPAVRRGDDLFTDSVVALHATTGKLAWYFQFTPSDDRDWDSTQTPVLIDYPRTGSPEKRLVFANRNGFYYMLDRTNGRFLGASAFVRQNWADRIDGNGRPLRRVLPASARLGQITYPGSIGGTNWWPPSYDPALNLIFVPVLEEGAILFPDTNRPPADSESQFYTAVRALDASSGALKWEYRRDPRTIDDSMGGLLSTSSGLVFGSDQSTFFALAARTGRIVYSIDTGANIAAPPITYSVGGQQFVAIASGRALLAFALPQGVRELAAPAARDGNVQSLDPSN